MITKRFFRSLAATAAAVSISGLAALNGSAAQDDGTLTVGDTAPQLDIEHWIQDNGGKLKPVNEFEDGKVYIVEFWATWCGPCIGSMPHLAETQTKYGYDDVRLISVSDEDLKTVTEFLAGKVRGEDEKTYSELTSVYSLTTDPDESVYEDYMRAAGQNGIPTAFLVGKKGIVEWIGHPMEMDEPLQQVVEGTWDREAFAEEFKKEQAAALLFAKIRKMMQSDDANPAQILESIESGLTELGDSAGGEVAQLQMMKLQLMIEMEKYDEVEKAIRKNLDDAGTDIQKVSMASRPIQMLPADSGIDIKSLVVLAAEKLDGTMGTPMIAGNKNMQAQVKFAIAQLYMVCDETDEAVAALKEAKGLAEDERMKTQLQEMIDSAESATTDDAADMEDGQ